MNAICVNKSARLRGLRSTGLTREMGTSQKPRPFAPRPHGDRGLVAVALKAVQIARLYSTRNDEVLSGRQFPRVGPLFVDLAWQPRRIVAPFSVAAVNFHVQFFAASPPLHRKGRSKHVRSRQLTTT
jgi:hypothetical protein